jgi:hypothetical protein
VEEPKTWRQRGCRHAQISRVVFLFSEQLPTRNGCGAVRKVPDELSPFVYSPVQPLGRIRRGQSTSVLGWETKLETAPRRHLRGAHPLQDASAGRGRPDAAWPSPRRGEARRLSCGPADPLGGPAYGGRATLADGTLAARYRVPDCFHLPGPRHNPKPRRLRLRSPTKRLAEVRFPPREWPVVRIRGCSSDLDENLIVIDHGSVDVLESQDIG